LNETYTLSMLACGLLTLPTWLTLTPTFPGANDWSWLVERKGENVNEVVFPLGFTNFIKTRPWCGAKIIRFQRRWRIQDT